MIVFIESCMDLVRRDSLRFALAYWLLVIPYFVCCIVYYSSGNRGFVDYIGSDGRVWRKYDRW